MWLQLPSGVRNANIPLRSSSEAGKKGDCGGWLFALVQVGTGGGEPNRASRGRDPFVLILQKRDIKIIFLTDLYFPIFSTWKCSTVCFTDFYKLNFVKLTYDWLIWGSSKFLLLSLPQKNATRVIIGENTLK
jgi:hypothetical protein